MRKIQSEKTENKEQKICQQQNGTKFPGMFCMLLFMLVISLCVSLSSIRILLITKHNIPNLINRGFSSRSV